MVTRPTKIRVPKFGALMLVVSFITLFIAIGSVLIMVRLERTEVTAQVLASDELTMYPAVAGLKGYFTYAGEEVAHLWKFRAKFVNSGDKTIVGVGNLRNILGDGLNFVFPDDTRILRIEEELETFESTIVQAKPNHFRIQFSQWRSGEYTIASFYVACDKVLHTGPFLTALTRDIIDGEIVIQDLTQERLGEPMFVIDRLPGAISSAGKILGALALGLLSIILLAIGVSGWKPALRLEKWKERYLSSFSEYLGQVEPALSEQDKKRFKTKPYTLPDILWAKFDGEKLTQVPSLDSRGVCMSFIISSLFMLFGSISLILMLIPA